MPSFRQSLPFIILTNAAVERILFKVQRAIGVEIAGKKAYARQEEISSAGALDSPKLLLLSGIGPKEEPSKHDIPMIDKLPASQTLEEFKELDGAVQEHFQDETKPSFELISHIPTFSLKAPEKYLATAVAFMGGQAAGEVRLRSGNPKDPPLLDPKFLSHPFDRRVAVKSVREALEIMDLPGLAKDQVRLATGQTGRIDEEILKYVRETGLSMCHMCGTVKMGKPAEPDACVDEDFRVRGVQGLRVVDISVAPLMPSAHLQAIAYVVGETAAEKIIAEYEQHYGSGISRTETRESAI